MSNFDDYGDEPPLWRVVMITSIVLFTTAFIVTYGAGMWN